MALSLREPKRKHRGSAPDNPPFPILTERSTGIPVCETTWRTYTGRFNGDSVIVEKLEDISALYFMGYYGKGSLSRGCAILGREKRKQTTILNERQWFRHELWMEMAVSNAERETASIIPSEKQAKRSGSDKDSDDGDSKERDKRRSQSGCPRPHSSTDQNITVIDDGDSENSDILEVDNSGKAGSVVRKRVFETQCDAKIDNNDPKRRKCSPEEKKQSQNDIEVVDLSSDEDCSNQNANKKCVETAARQLTAATPVSRPPGSPSVIAPSNHGETEVVVLSDVDSEDEDYFSKLKPRLEYEPTYLAREKLVLSLEEAMFLSYGLGCLRILGPRGEELSLTDMWKLFQESQKTFIQRYVAYHYFRSKGWVVKSGLKFGGDFALYKEGPHLYHSTYIVVVEVIDQGTSMRNATLSGRPTTWTQLMGLSRLSEAAGKEVLICQVVWPAIVPKENVPSPRVISSFQVNETLLRRWIPSQDRTDPQKSRDEGNLNEGSSTEAAVA